MPTPSLSLSGKPQTQKCAEARQHVKDLLTALTSGEADTLFALYLDCAGRFWRYSPQNIMLIMGQNPTATRVAGRSTWAEMNRHILRGAKATWIFAPNFHTENVIDKETGDVVEVTHRHFTLVPLFDVAQTAVFQGRRDLYVPTFQRQLQNVEPLVAAATAWGKSVGYRIEFRPLFRQVQGLGYATGGGRLAVDSTVDVGAQLPTLTHELSHLRLSHLDREDIDRSLAEGEAEATSYIILKHFGYDSPASAAYLSNHRVTAERVKGSLKRITEAAADIIDGIESHLPSPRQEEPTMPAPIEASP